MIYQLENKIPKIQEGGYIAPNATIIGSVIVGQRVGIWFQSVIRGDDEEIIIGDNTNIQDLCVLHTDERYKLVIGENVTIGHNSLLHGCTISDNCFIGLGSVILNGSKIGKNCIIGARSLIGQHKEIPDNSFVVGSPARIIRAVTEEEKIYIKKAAEIYLNRIIRYQNLGLVSSPDSR